MGMNLMTILSGMYFELHCILIITVIGVVGVYRK